MSAPTNEVDMSLWEAYLAECKVLGVKPKMKDYLIFLQEADIDREEQIWDETV